MENKKTFKLRVLKSSGSFFLVAMFLLASHSTQANAFQPGMLRAVQAPDSIEIFKLLVDPVIRQFKEENHALLTKVGSPFACVRSVESKVDAGQGAGTQITLEMDWTETLEKAIVGVFIDHFDAMKNGDFLGFEKALGEVLSQENYHCLQDMGRFSIHYRTDNSKFYDGWAYTEVMEIVKKVIPPIKLGLAPLEEQEEPVVTAPTFQPPQLETPEWKNYWEFPAPPPHLAATRDSAQIFPETDSDTVNAKEDLAAPDGIVPARVSGYSGSGCTLQASSGGNLELYWVFLALPYIVSRRLRRGAGAAGIRQ